MLGLIQCGASGAQGADIEPEFDPAIAGEHVGEPRKQAVITVEQAVQQAAEREVDGDGGDAAIERGRQRGRVATEQHEIRRVPAAMHPDVIETGVDADYAEVGLLPGEAQGEGGVPRAEIEMDAGEPCAPGGERRRCGREEERLVHRGAFPVRSEKPKAEKAGRRTTCLVVRSEPVKDGRGVMQADRQARQGDQRRAGT